MEHVGNGVQTFESRELLDPILLISTENESHSSEKNHQWKNINRHSLYTGWTSPAVSANDDQYLNSSQRKFKHSKVSRSSSVHSWHGTVNREEDKVLADTQPEDSTLSRISLILKSLRSFSIAKSFSQIPKEEQVASINSRFISSQNDQSIVNHINVASSETGNEAKDIPGLDLSVSIDSDTDAKLLEPVPSLDDGDVWKISTKEKCQSKSKIRCLLGIAANFLFIGPLVVVYWNSTWNLCDRLLFSDSCQSSVWASAGIGFSIMILVTLLQDPLLSFSASCNKPVRYVVTRIYTYVVSIGCINQWRSVWYFSNCFVGTSLLNSALSFAVSAAVLLVLRCFRSVPAPPVYVSLEVPHSYHYKVATFSGNPPTRSVRFLVDVVFTVVGVQVLSVTCWRGLWEVMDQELFPDDSQASAIWSVGISFVLSGMLLSLNIPIKGISRCLHGQSWLLLLIFEDVITVLYSVVCIANWRGIWLLLNIYTPAPPTGLYVEHSVSFVILAVGLAANSLLVRGVQSDSSSLDRCGVIFDMTYMTTVLQAWRKRQGLRINQENKQLPFNCEDSKPINV